MIIWMPINELCKKGDNKSYEKLMFVKGLL